ncbi:MAG: sensor histidine kinase [Pseudomonadota bacterium]
MAEEIQHRVRNNLQLVYGMLNRQLQTVTDEAAKRGFGAIARRVMTLAQVYDHLLGTGLSRRIDFGGYLSSLCTSFKDLESAHHRDIELTSHCEAVILDLDSVTALGLVVAELISNSYVHAFPGGTERSAYRWYAAIPAMRPRWCLPMTVRGSAKTATASGTVWAW